MALLRQLGRLAPALSEGGGSLRRAFAAEAQASSGKWWNIPEGHSKNDLSPEVCHIGLNRRRELALGAAGQIKLTVGGAPTKLEDLFRGKKTVLFGVPDRGAVCASEHVPSFLKERAALAALGVDQLLCVVVAPPAEAAAWGATVGVDGAAAAVAADESGAFTRLMGLERGAPDAPGARSLRYAAVVDGAGVLLKLKVEKSLGEVKESGGPAVVALLKSMQIA